VGKEARLRWAAAALLLAAAFPAGWALVVEPRRLVVRAERLAPPRWPAALGGLRVVALSDIHAGGPHATRARLREVVATANRQEADLVVLLGDYVQGHAVDPDVPPEAMATELGALRGRLPTVAVLGNHDWWLDGRRVGAALTRAGIRVLENEAVRLEVKGQALWVAGLADLWTRDADIRSALSGIPGGEPVLLLTHNPDVFPDVPREVSLTLAGHTHGGQVDLPLLGPLIVPSRFGQRYASGLVVEEGRLLFVTSGVAMSILPVRFRVPPEVAVLTLVSG
jgi:uncharacterized protein